MVAPLEGSRTERLGRQRSPPTLLHKSAGEAICGRMKEEAGVFKSTLADRTSDPSAEALRVP
eukprot:scaffold1337_cov350-Prasinococcus_capsulatus_cf.AAC.1